MTAQDPSTVTPPTTEDQLVKSGLLALRDLTSLPDSDPQRAKAADAFGAVWDYATSRGVLRGASNPDVADMWFEFVKRSRATISRDGARRAAGPKPRLPDISDARPMMQTRDSFDVPFGDTSDGILSARMSTVTDVTDRPSVFGGERDGTFLVNKGALGIPADPMSKSAIEFGELLTNPALERDGKRYVRTGAGEVEIPNIAPAKDQIRQFLAGERPGFGGAVMQRSAIEGLARRLARWTNDVFGLELLPGAKADTQSDGIPSLLGRQPEVIPFYPGDVERSYQAMQDPAHMRAFLDMEQELEKSGEAKKTVGESVAGLAEFAAEYAAFQGLAGKAAAPLARAARSAAMIEKYPFLARAAETGASWIKAAGAGKTKPYTPIFQMSARTVLEMGTFEAFRAAVNGDESMTAAALHGAGEGALLAGLNLGASGASRLAGSLIKRTKYGGWVKTLDELLTRAGESDFERAKLARWASRMPSENPNFVAQVAKQIGSKYAAEQLVRMKDMAIVASTLAGFDFAKRVSGKSFPQLLVQDPRLAGQLMIQGMTSKEALGNVLGFWSGAAITGGFGQEGVFSYLRGQSPEIRAQAERVVKDWAFELAHPRDPEKVVEAGVLFDKLRSAHPELTDGIEFEGYREPTRYRPPPEAPGSAPAAPVSPKPDFGGGVSPGGRSRARVEEMYGFWSPATAVRTEQGVRWKPDVGEDPSSWIQEGGRYAIARGRDGMFHVKHAEGERAGQRVRTIEPTETFEAAVARANKLAQQTVTGRPATLPPYKTDREPTPLYPEEDRPADQGPPRRKETGQLGFARQQRELEERLRNAQDDAERSRILGEQEARLRAELAKPGPQATAARRVQRTMDWIAAAKLAMVKSTDDPVARQRLEVEFDFRTRQLEEDARQASKADYDALSAELRRREQIYQRHRTDPDKLALSPDGVVEKAERQRASTKRYADLARTWALKPGQVRALLEGAPGMGPVQLEEAQGMDPVARLRAADARLKIGRVARAKAATKQRNLAVGNTSRADLATYLRTRGGLRWDEGTQDIDLEGLKQSMQPKIPGLPSLVRPKGSGKGMTAETALQEAIDAGYLPPGSGLHELDEALAGGLLTQEGYERQAEREMAEQYEQWKREHPAGLADSSPGARNVDEASRTDTDVPTRIAQSSEAARAAREILEAGNVVDPWEQPSSVHAAVMLRRLANADPELLEQMRAAMPPEQAAELLERGVQSARAASAYFQQAVQKHADGIGRGDAVHAYLRAVDDLAQRGNLTDETRALLKPHELLSKEGGLHESAPKTMAQLAQDMVWDAHGQGDAGVTYLYAGLPTPRVMLAPMDKGSWNSPWNPFRVPSVEGNEFIAAKISRGIGRAFERLGEGKGPKVLVAANRELTMAIGRFWSAAGMPRWMKQLHYQLENQLKSPAARERAAAMFEKNWFLSKLRADGKRLPMYVRSELLRLIDARYFVDGKIKSPEELAKHVGPQYGHLYYDVERLNSVMSELGSKLVDVGSLSEGQFEKLKGAWVMRQWLRIDQETVAEALRSGNYTIPFLPGRDLARVTEPVVTTQIRNWDPDVVLHGGISQETRMLEMFRWLHGLANLDYGFAFTAEELRTRHARGGREWSDADLQWLEPVATDPEYAIRKNGRDDVTGRKHAGRSLQRGAMLRQWRESMQSEEEWRSNSPLLKGQHPYTPAKAQLLDALLPIDGTPGLYITRDTSEALDEVIRELTYHPHTKGLAESAKTNESMQYVGRKLDEVSRFWRKTRTVQRASHWFRNIVSSVMTNHQTGGVSMGDFTTSVLFGQGHYANAMRRQLWWEKWLQNGRPHDEGELGKLGLLDAWRNGHLQQADKIITTLGEGTFHKTLIDTGSTSAMLGNAISRDEIKAYVESELKNSARERASAGGLPFEEGALGESDRAILEQLTDSVAELARRSSGGLGSVDEAIVNAFEKLDAGARLAAIAQHGAQYQAWEITFKYANALEYLGNNPGMTIEDAIARGAAGTADYRNTSPALRRWSTQFNLALDPQRKAWEQYAGLKMAARFTFASPFMLYGNNIRPTQLDSMFAYPLRTAQVAGMWAAIAAATTYAVGYTADQLLEGLPGSPGYQGQYVIPADDLKRYAEQFGNVPYAPPALSPHLTVKDKKLLSQLIPRVMANLPYVSYGPAKSGAAQLTDFGAYAAPASTLSDVWRDANNWPSMSNRERGEAIARSLYGLGLETLASTLQQIGKAVYGKPGQSGMQTTVDAVEEISRQWASLGHPVLSMISPEMQRVTELGFTDGQPLPEWLSGKLDPFARSRSPESGAMQAMFAATFGERREPSYNELPRDDDSIVGSMLNDISPKWDIGLSSSEQKDTLRVARSVRDEIALVLQSTYDYYRSRPQGGSFGDLLKGQLDVHRDLRLDGNALTVSEKPETTLGKFLAGFPEKERSTAANTLVKLLYSKAFKSEAIPVVMDAAAARRIDPGLLYRVYKAALTGGTGPVLRQMYDELQPSNPSKGNFENLPEWYDIFTKVSAPATGSPAWKQWNELRMFLRDVCRGDILLPDAPGITRQPRTLQDMGNADLIEMLPARWAKERRKQ